jgi:transcription elongation GreA/GreB family factor
MSRAFVKESDDAGEPLPELSVSPHPNFVTPSGLALIEQRIAALGAELRAARDREDKALLARINRDLRYWTQRRASARPVPAAVGPLERVRFGTHVTVRFADGTERDFRIVGEDEADPARGLVSWVSPIAKALLGKGPGEDVEVPGRAAVIVGLAP